MYRITCSNCHKRLKISDFYAGRRILCPECKQDLIVPREQASNETGSPSLTEDTLLRASVREDKTSSWP